MSKISTALFLTILILFSCEKKGDCYIEIIDGGDTLRQKTSNLTEEECNDRGGEWYSY